MPLSFHAAMALAGSASVRLMMPGGEARPGELAMVGPLALFAADGRRILVPDAAKFGRSALAVAGKLSEFDILVTDSSAPSGPLAELEAAAVEVRRV